MQEARSSAEEVRTMRQTQILRTSKRRRTDDVEPVVIPTEPVADTTAAAIVIAAIDAAIEASQR